MDNLTATALAAQKSGMSYGNYVALHGVRNINKPIVVDEPVKVCKECGAEFPASGRKRGAVYCSEVCREAVNMKRTLERYHSRKKEKTNG